MDPNQQPNQPQQPQQPQQPYAQPPTSYASTAPVEYDPNYLDSIAPPPAPGKFLSGTFGKIFYLLIGLFVLGVSLIIAFSGGDDTADLQQMAVRLDNFSLTAKTVQPKLRSKNLANINSIYEIWLTGNKTAAADLLKKGGIQKSQYNREMTKSEKAYTTALDAKYEDARLSAKLNRVYANSMAAETEKLMNMLTTMNKKSKSKQIRDFAKTAMDNLKPIQKNFEEYNDDGN